MSLNLANILTISRIVFVPVIAFSFFVDSSFSRWLATFLFMVACLTDYLDGYIARSWSQTTKVGQFLDPVADKLLVASTLLLLAGFGRISHMTMLPALIILWREILVSELRDGLSAYNINVTVSKLSQWKTTSQMLAISFLLIGKANSDSRFIKIILFAGEGLLWMAAFLTLYSGFLYFQRHLKQLKKIVF